VPRTCPWADNLKKKERKYEVNVESRSSINQQESTVLVVDGEYRSIFSQKRNVSAKQINSCQFSTAGQKSRQTADG